MSQIRGKSSTYTTHAHLLRENRGKHTHTNTGSAGCINYSPGAMTGIQHKHPLEECGRAMLNGLCRGRDLMLSWISVSSRRTLIGPLIHCSRVHFWIF